MKVEKIKSFTDLDTWKEAHSLVLMIYEITKNFPKEEKFGLVNQMRRAGNPNTKYHIRNTQLTIDDLPFTRLIKSRRARDSTPNNYTHTRGFNFFCSTAFKL